MKRHCDEHNKYFPPMGGFLIHDSTEAARRGKPPKPGNTHWCTLCDQYYGSASLCGSVFVKQSICGVYWLDASYHNMDTRLFL